MKGASFIKFFALDAIAGPIKPATIPPNITKETPFERNSSDVTSTAAKRYS